jgi:hypothetical protein
VTRFMDNFGAMFTGTMLAFAILVLAPFCADLPAKLRRLRRRWFPSSLLID